MDLRRASVAQHDTGNLLTTDNDAISQVRPIAAPPNIRVPRAHVQRARRIGTEHRIGFVQDLFRNRQFLCVNWPEADVLLGFGIGLVAANDEFAAHRNRLQFDIEAKTIFVRKSDADPRPRGFLSPLGILVVVNDQDVVSLSGASGGSVGVHGGGSSVWRLMDSGSIA
jgi:hypothetical protein